VEKLLAMKNCLDSKIDFVKKLAFVENLMHGKTTYTKKLLMLKIMCIMKNY
jgi:hypothetical protein